MAVMASIYAETRKRDAASWVRHTITVESSLHQFAATLRRVQSGERGYLLTQEEQYLEPYEAVAPQVQIQIDKLRDLLADAEAQQQAMDRLVPLVNERLQLLKWRTQAVREGRSAEALASFKTGHGRDLTDQAFKILDSILREEDALYQKRQQAYYAASEWLSVIFGFLFLSLAASALFIVLSSERHLYELEGANRKLQAANQKIQMAYDEVIEQARQRVKVESQLRQSQKLEALGQLAGGIAHDFNNLLSVILASLNIVRRKLRSGSHEIDGLIDSAEEGVNKAARLVRRLLAFSREQPLDPKVVNPNELIRGMSDILRRTLGSDVELEKQLADGLWETCIDSHELENALLNLVVNARDAMPGGGRLVIATENISIDENYAAQNPGLKPGEFVKVSVSDTGEGMPAEVVARAFDPFFTTKPVGKGTGLGLSQVHGFVRQSNGAVKVYSELGHGTSVAMLFPRFLGSFASSVSRENPDLPFGHPEEILLIVDDDPTARRLTVMAAKELGYNVLEADGGKAAIEILKRQPEIKLLVTDVVMPEMDGAQLTREAVFRRHDLRVLYMTGFPRAFLVRHNIQTENVLTKPFTLRQFAEAVRVALGRPPMSPP
jgi:signal transduction histidine kinase/CheY-like chemotaxis protein